MKTRNITLLGIASGLAISTGSLLAQSTAVTPPVGYRTELIKTGVFNLLAPNLSQPVAASGAFESSTTTTVTDNDATFDTALTGTKYTLLITSGAGSGVSSKITSWTATALSTQDDLSAVVAADVKYEVRATQTLSSLFGATNAAGLKANADSGLADLVWVPSGSGYIRYYYNPTAGGFPPKTVGWKSTTSGDTNQGDAEVALVDGVFIESRSAADYSVVFTGHVVTTEPVYTLSNGFNTLSRVLPVGVSLGDSNLEVGLAQSPDSGVADLIWNPDGSGGFVRYYYNNVAGGFPPKTVGWKSTTSGDTDQSAAVLNSGYIIEVKGAGGSVKLNYPTNLDLN